jgi:hypothetical protein
MEEVAGTMYKKLLPHLNRFIYLRQGYFSRYYEGKIVEVTPETITIQTYDDNGREDSVWTIAMPTITEFMIGDRELDELNMRVCLAKSLSIEEEAIDDSDDDDPRDRSAVEV